MINLLHRYVRRFVCWVNQPSDEERRRTVENKRRARIAWAAGRLSAGQTIMEYKFRGITPEDAEDWIDCFRAAAQAGAPDAHLGFHINAIERLSMCRTLQL